MPAPAKSKFLFNADFSPYVDPSDKPITAAEHAAKLAEAEADGYRKGFAAAQAESNASGPLRNAAALERIAAATEQMVRSLAATEARLEAEAVEVAVAVARKLAGELIAREPMAEIETLAKSAFRQLVAVPHVVVRVNEALHEFVREQIQSVAHERGFDGRLVVLAEPDIAVGDCRIEWADGGIVRDRSARDAAVAELIAQYIAARRLPNGAPGEKP